MKTILLGAVAYDAKVVTIWESIRAHFQSEGVPLDFALGEGKRAGQVGPVFNMEEPVDPLLLESRAVDVPFALGPQLGNPALRLGQRAGDRGTSAG